MDSKLTLAFVKNLCFNNSAAVGLNTRKDSTLSDSSGDSWKENRHSFYTRQTKDLNFGSFCKHRESIFLKDLPYFFTISLSVMPVSRQGGSFCKVSISTCTHVKAASLIKIKRHQSHTAQTAYSVLCGLQMFLWGLQ